MDTPEDERTRARDRGIAPETAAAELRAILEAGGEGSGILAQSRGLVRWAGSRGTLLGAGFDVGEFRDGGLVHRIAFDESAGIVYKLTYGAGFGRTCRDPRRGLAPATPLEYLDRWSIHNRLFGRITWIVGVLNPEGDDFPRVVVGQTAIRGELPSVERVAAFMVHAGFTPLGWGQYSWIASKQRIAIFDARPANFVGVEELAVPFDLIPVRSWDSWAEVR